MCLLGRSSPGSPSLLLNRRSGLVGWPQGSASARLVQSATRGCVSKLVNCLETAHLPVARTRPLSEGSPTSAQERAPTRAWTFAAGRLDRAPGEPRGDVTPRRALASWVAQ